MVGEAALRLIGNHKNVGNVVTIHVAHVDGGRARDKEACAAAERTRSRDKADVDSTTGRRREICECDHEIWPPVAVHVSDGGIAIRTNRYRFPLIGTAIHPCGSIGRRSHV
jgi:hypothetical protein